MPKSARVRLAGTVERVVCPDGGDAPVTSEDMSESGPVEGAGPQSAAVVELRLIDQLVDRAQAVGLRLAGEGGLLQRLIRGLLGPHSRAG
jgi:hypothetical protein